MKKQKEDQILAKEERLEKKREERELFFRCKEQCVCTKAKCDASGLKECSICHNILKSTCGKAACKTDGKPLKTILPASSCKQNIKRKFDWDDKSDNEYTSADDMDVEDDSFETDKEIDDEKTDDEETNVDMENILRETWQAFSPPTEKVNVVGNWCAVIYKGKRAVTLFIAKTNKRFLKDENGTVDKLLMTGNILEETPPDQRDV